MKNIFFIVAVVISASLTQKVFAADTHGEKVARNILESFRRDFILTSEASWNKIGDAFVVSFKQQGISYMAYYTGDGLLNSISNNIEEDQLPEAVTAQILARYENAKIIRVLKVRSLSDGIFYIIPIYSGSAQKIIKAYPSGNIETIRAAR